MFQYFLQGLAMGGTLVVGAVGMLLNDWIKTYKEDKHFYKTRFLDRDGDPTSPDPGYLKDASGKLIPIIVETYSFGKPRKKRYVEGLELCGDGKHGLPFKMSLEKFRNKEIRKTKVVLCPVSTRLVQEYFQELSDKTDQQRNELSTNIRDLARSVDGLKATTQHLRKAILKNKE